jgi:hypothetical protein
LASKERIKGGHALAGVSTELLHAMETEIQCDL